MKITNKNIRKTLLLLLVAAFFLAAGDLILSMLDGSLGDVFKGYSAIVIPSLLIIVYSYLGFPLFSFDAEAEVWHIRSHTVFNRFVGKELYVARANLVGIEVDRSGIRKKMVIRFMKEGEERSEKFSISLLSQEKIDKLVQLKDIVEAEVNKPASNQLFI